MIPCPGSSFHGIFPAKILEWVAISFSRGSSWPRDRTHISCIGRWILYHWAAWECQGALHFVVIFSWYLYMKNWVKETAVNRPLVMWQYAVGAGRHCIILCLGVPLHCELHRYFSVPPFKMGWSCVFLFFFMEAGGDWYFSFSFLHAGGKSQLE